MLGLSKSTFMVKVSLNEMLNLRSSSRALTLSLYYQTTECSNESCILLLFTSPKSNWPFIWTSIWMVWWAEEFVFESLLSTQFTQVNDLNTYWFWQLIARLAIRPWTAGYLAFSLSPGLPACYPRESSCI